jgi:hypothetical protein
MADNTEKVKAQADKLGILQDLLLDDFITMAREHTLSATDRATLVRFLMANGWNLDPANMPQELKDMLTSRIDPTKDLEEEHPHLRIAR